LGDGALAEIGGQAGDGLLNGRLVPVVAHAVAQAGAAEQALLLGRTVLMDRPLRGIAEHGVLHDAGKRGAKRGGEELGLDGGEGEDRLAHGKGEGGSDLEDGEVVAHQAFVGAGSLVVGRVRLKDQAVGLVEQMAQIVHLLGHVVDDGLVVELDARLDDEADDAQPSGVQAARVKDLPMEAQGLLGGAARGDLDRLEAFGGSAGTGTTVPMMYMGLAPWRPARPPRRDRPRALR